MKVFFNPAAALPCLPSGRAVPPPSLQLLAQLAGMVSKQAAADEVDLLVGGAGGCPDVGSGVGWGGDPGFKALDQVGGVQVGTGAGFRFFFGFKVGF